MDRTLIFAAASTAMTIIALALIVHHSHADYTARLHCEKDAKVMVQVSGSRFCADVAYEVKP